MTSKERLVRAIKKEKTDRLPVTTHQLMTYFLDKYMEGASNDEFFAAMDLDPIRWVYPHKPNTAEGCYYKPNERPRSELRSMSPSSESREARLSRILGLSRHLPMRRENVHTN